MSGVLDAAAGLTVGQRAVAVGLIACLAVALGIGLTAWLTSLRVALALWLGGIAALMLYVVFAPVQTADLAARPRPEPDFAAAKARFAAEVARNTVPLNPLCPSRLLEHGARTPKVVVLLHGISSCPQAFVDFAPLLHARGHTVLALRMPRNGYADRATDALSRLSAEELREYGDAAVDIAAGLGDEVIVLGISAGGTVAAWAGQNRAEVDRAMLVAPFFGLSGFGARINLVLMRVMLVMPDVSIWKDPVLRARFEGMPHAYKRQSTRGTGQVMRLGYATYQQQAEAHPAAASAVTVTNDNDTAVDNSMTDAFAARWRAAGLPVASYVFPKSDGLGHEIIDPLEPGADPALTYPVLLRLIEMPIDGLRATD